MLKNNKILVVGSLVMDLIMSTEKFPSSGETVVGSSFAKASGGKGANQAVQIARLGGRVDMVGRIGDDIFGQDLIKACSDSHVNVDGIIQTENTASGISDVLLEIKKGEQTRNRIIMNPSANFKLTVDDVLYLASTIETYSLVVLQFEITMAVNEYIARIAHENNIPVLLNPAPSAPISDDFYSHLTYIAPNETEVRDLTGFTVIGVDGRPDIEALRKAATFFKSRGVKNVIVTLGSNGVFFSGVSGEYLVPVIKNVVAVDPTAAGDSFIGAFSLAISNGVDTEKALLFGNLVASITVETLGAMPSLPTLSKAYAVALRKEVKGVNLVFETLNKNNETIEDPLSVYRRIILEEVGKTIGNLNDDFYTDAVNLIVGAQEKGKRIHITGIGKPAYVAQYLASLLSSTGTPTYFLHGTEAVHGSCGQLVKGDIVIAISNSGETAELKATVLAVKNNGCYILGVSGNANSWLAKQSTVHLLAGISREGGPLNRAPRSSILAEAIVLQGLSVILQARLGLSPTQYVKWHPGGKLGELKKEEK